MLKERFIQELNTINSRLMIMTLLSEQDNLWKKSEKFVKNSPEDYLYNLRNIKEIY